MEKPHVAREVVQAMQEGCSRTVEDLADEAARTIAKDEDGVSIAKLPPRHLAFSTIKPVKISLSEGPHQGFLAV